MKIQQRNTAVLLFTRIPAEEARAKDFAGYYNANRVIAHKLISHTVRVIRKSGLPYFIVDSSQQHGNNFGEKFTEALGQIFSRGTDRVIAIGNDCPTLTSHDLREAAYRLQSAEYALGPASDGGFYLIGLNKNSFDKEFLLRAPWESDKLSAYFLDHLQQESIPYFLGETKSDLDTPRDLSHIISFQHRSLFTLISFIKSVLASLAGFKITSTVRLPGGFVFQTVGLRAPPIFPSF